ncbi:extended synaptotagmin-2-like isoform X1 [Branchiostoma lanceolatum]|uniref:extended synaptotagmin-2-like isoform X1 n=1 Tax=Branchiostoma lanceolatum TaxID=7740 RepID=UPI003452FF94
MADSAESGAEGAGSSAGGTAGSAAGGDGQAPGGETQPSPTVPSRLKVNEDLLVLIKKYAIQLGILVVVWLVGYWAFSVSWIMLGLFVWMWREKKQKAKEFKIKTARNAAQNEQATVLARLEDLPSWVYFPDVERAEWLNKILAQLWPYVGRYVEDILRSSVEPVVKDSHEMLRSFQFSNIMLGDMPPRVGGIQVYTEHVHRNEIILDMEIMYAGDCDIQIRMKRFLAGIQDLQIHGTLRVVMKPLVKFSPLIGGITVFFLNRPEIDFNLTNLADVFDFPGLSSLLKGIVADQVSNFMVLPNRYPMPLIPDLEVAKLKYPMPVGVLRIHLKEAKELMRADVGFMKKGKSDPYCTLQVGAQSFKSKTIENTLEPRWNEYYEAVVDQLEGQTMQVNMFDEDPGSKDDPLGNAAVSISEVVKMGFSDVWLPLEDATTGQVHLRMSWLSLSSQMEALDKYVEHWKDRARQFQDHGSIMEAMYSKSCHLMGQSLPETLRGRVDESLDQMEKVKRIADADALSSALLVVRVDSAKNLPPSDKKNFLTVKKSGSDPNPYVELSVAQKHWKTKPQYNTYEPVWEEAFNFLIQNPLHQELLAEVKDEKTKKTLGKKVISVKSLLTLDKMSTKRPFRLDGTSAELHMELILRILSSEADESDDLDEIEPISPTAAGPSTPAAPPTEPAQPSPASSTEDRQANNSNGSVVRRRNNAANASTTTPTRPKSEPAAVDGPNPYASQVQLSLHHSADTDKLLVTVHKATNLMPQANQKMCDPYVRIYLQPDKNRSGRKKTSVVKDNVNPAWDETLEFPVTLAEAKQRSLDIVIKNKRSLFETIRGNSTGTLGRVEVDLSKVDNLATQNNPIWFDLKQDFGSLSRSSSVSSYRSEL